MAQEVGFFFFSLGRKGTIVLKTYQFLICFVFCESFNIQPNKISVYFETLLN